MDEAPQAALPPHYAGGVNSRTGLEKWLKQRPAQQLTALLEERDLPLAAGHTRMTTPRELAEHLLTDESVARGLTAGTAGEMELLASVAALALRQHGPVTGQADPRPPYGWRPAPVTVQVEPSERLVPEKEVLAWFTEGGARRQAADTLARLRERALLLPAPKGQLALPPLLHVRAAGFDGYGRPADRLLTAAYNAPEVKRIATVLFGESASRTRPEAQTRITTLLADPVQVRDLVSRAPSRARELLDNLVLGPPLLRTHCFATQYGSYAGPGAKYTFREGGSGDEGTDWLAARALLLPAGPDLVELPYEVARALRDGEGAPSPRLEPEPLTRTAPLPRGWDGQGGAAAGGPPGARSWSYGRWPRSRSLSAKRAASPYGTPGAWPDRPVRVRRTPACGSTSPSTPAWPPRRPTSPPPRAAGGGRRPSPRPASSPATATTRGRRPPLPGSCCR